MTSVHYKLHTSTPFTYVGMQIKDVEKYPHPMEKVFSFFDFWVKKSPHLDRRWGGYWTLNSLGLFFQGTAADAKVDFDYSLCPLVLFALGAYGI